MYIRPHRTSRDSQDFPSPYLCWRLPFYWPSLPLSHPSVCVCFLQDSIGLLLDAVKTSNEELAQTWKKSEQWATIEQLCSEYFCCLTHSETLVQTELC